MKYRVIANPTAGRGRVINRIGRLVEILDREKIQYDLVYTHQAGDGTQLAAEAVLAGYEGVVAVGGDGTVHEVLNGIYRTNQKVALGIVPLGTGNDLARTLQIPFELEEAVQVLKDGHQTFIDLGVDRDGFFSIILGIGFPADVMHHVNTVQNSIRGPLAIFLSVYRVLNKLQPYRVTVHLDDQVIDEEVMGVFILNTRYTGGGMKMVPNAVHDDGILDIMILKKMNKLDLICTMPLVYRGKHFNHPKVCFYRSRSIEIRSDEPMRKVFDGNVYGETPLKTEVMPKQLSVLVPKEVD